MIVLNIFFYSFRLEIINQETNAPKEKEFIQKLPAYKYNKFLKRDRKILRWTRKQSEFHNQPDETCSSLINNVKMYFSIAKFHRANGSYCALELFTNSIMTENEKQMTCNNVSSRIGLTALHDICGVHMCAYHENENL